MTLSLDVNAASIASIERAQSQLNSAVAQFGAESGGLTARMTEAILQLNRFVLGNIEVDTGRTKNSIFPDVRQDGNSVTAMLGTNVSYSPYVRDKGHGEPFFDYAERVEVPGVLEWLGADIVARVEGAFD